MSLRPRGMHHRLVPGRGPTPADLARAGCCGQRLFSAGGVSQFPCLRLGFLLVPLTFGVWKNERVGPVSWFEIPVVDVERAAEFYG